MTVPPEQPLNDDSSIGKAIPAWKLNQEYSDADREELKNNLDTEKEVKRKEAETRAAEAEAAVKAREEEARKKAEAAAKGAEEKARREAEEEARKKAEEEAARKKAEEEKRKRGGLEEEDLKGEGYPEKVKPEPGTMSEEDVRDHRNPESIDEVEERKQRRDQAMAEMQRYGFDEASMNAAQALLDKGEDQPNYETLMPRQRLQGWGRALLSFTDNRGKRAIERLDAGTKLLGAIRRLTRSFLSPSPMSVPAAIASEAAVGFGTIYDHMDRIGELKGIKQNADRNIAFETPKGARYFRDKDRAEKVNKYIIQQYNDLIQDAVGPDGDPSQIGFAQWDSVRQRMNRMLEPEIDRIENMAQRGVTPSMEDMAIMEAYKSLNKRNSAQNKAFARRYRRIMQGRKDEDFEIPKWDSIRARYEAEPEKYENQLMIMNILGDDVAENFKDDNISEHYIRRAYKQLNLMKEQAKAEGDDKKLELYDKYAKRLEYLAYDVTSRRPEKPNEARRREGREAVNAMREKPLEHVGELVVLNLLGNDEYLDFRDGKPTASQYARARREANARYNDAKLKDDSEGMVKWRKYIDYIDRIIGESPETAPAATPKPTAAEPTKDFDGEGVVTTPGKYDDLYSAAPRRVFTTEDLDKYTTEELQEILDDYYNKMRSQNLTDQTKKIAAKNRTIIGNVLSGKKIRNEVTKWYGEDIRDETYDIIKDTLHGEKADVDLSGLTDEELDRLGDALKRVLDDANDRKLKWENGERVYNGDLTDEKFYNRSKMQTRILHEKNKRSLDRGSEDTKPALPGPGFKPQFVPDRDAEDNIIRNWYAQYDADQKQHTDNGANSTATNTDPTNLNINTDTEGVVTDNTVNTEGGKPQSTSQDIVPASSYLPMVINNDEDVLDSNQAAHEASSPGVAQEQPPTSPIALPPKELASIISKWLNVNAEDKKRINENPTEEEIEQIRTVLQQKDLILKAMNNEAARKRCESRLKWMEKVIKAHDEGMSRADAATEEQKRQRAFNDAKSTLDTKLRDILVGRGPGKKLVTSEDLEKVQALMGSDRFKDLPKELIMNSPVYSKLLGDVARYGNVESAMFNGLYNRVMKGGALNRDEMRYILQNANRIRAGKSNTEDDNSVRLDRMMDHIDAMITEYDDANDAEKKMRRDEFQYENVGGDDIIPYIASGSLDGFIKRGDLMSFVDRLADDKYKKSVRDAIIKYNKLGDKLDQKGLMNWLQNTPEGKKLARTLYLAIVAGGSLPEKWSLGPMFPNVSQLRNMGSDNLVTAKNRVFDLDTILNDKDVPTAVAEGVEGLRNTSYDNPNGFDKIYGTLQSRLSSMDDANAGKFRDELLMHVQKEGYITDSKGNRRPRKWVGGVDGWKGVLDLVREDAGKRGAQYQAETDERINAAQLGDKPQEEAQQVPATVSVPAPATSTTATTPTSTVPTSTVPTGDTSANRGGRKRKGNAGAAQPVRVETRQVMDDDLEKKFEEEKLAPSIKQVRFSSSVIPPVPPATDTDEQTLRFWEHASNVIQYVDMTLGKKIDMNEKIHTIERMTKDWSMNPLMIYAKVLGRIQEYEENPIDLDPRVEKAIREIEDNASNIFSFIEDSRRRSG